MSTDWVAKSFSKNSTPVAVDDSYLDEEVVILLQGKNSFNDRIFSYLKLTFRNFLVMREVMALKKPFLPSDFGTVLAAGKGDPTPELRSEMAIAYQLVDTPQFVPQMDTAPPPPPKPDFSHLNLNIGKLWED